MADFTSWIIVVIFTILCFHFSLVHSAKEECVNNRRLTNGCNTLGLFETYKDKLTPSCDVHDICYYCVSTFKLFILSFPFVL